MSGNDGRRRVRVERGIYRQTNGRFAVFVMVDGRPRFRTVDATSLAGARREREALQIAAERGELTVSPRSTFGSVATRWLAEFEGKVAAGQRRERTLELYSTHLHVHLLPRLGPRRLTSIGPDEIAALARELRTDGLVAWTIKGILATLSCVCSYAFRHGYITSQPFARLERDERPRPAVREQRALSRSDLTRLFTA